MQSSVSSRFPGIVSLRSRLRGRTAATTRRIGSLSRLHQPPIFRSEHDTTTTATATTSCSVRDHHRNHVDRRRPFRIRFSAQTHQQQRQQQQPPRRIHSTLASKSFWRGLHQAVRQGNGSQAEEIAEQVLQDYYRLALLSSSSSQQQQQQSDLIDGSFDAGMDSDRQLCFDDAAASFGNSNNKYNESIAEVPPLLDSQIFSLVLQAWKNSDCPSLHSALRAHNLLIQMAALADQDVLCDPPVLDDYLAVLECWHQASSPNEHDEQQQQRQQQQQQQHHHHHRTKQNHPPQTTFSNGDPSPGNGNGGEEDRRQPGRKPLEKSPRSWFGSLPGTGSNPPTARKTPRTTSFTTRPVSGASTRRAPGTSCRSSPSREPPTPVSKYRGGSRALQSTSIRCGTRRKRRATKTNSSFGPTRWPRNNWEIFPNNSIWFCFACHPEPATGWPLLPSTGGTPITTTSLVDRFRHNSTRSATT
mmetsp:Transcript_5792/g.12340  ORF Transcript_5792/g.12340 Transcript_5792/m.12340 type:complete len:472 (+) Transcript_5792:111-1526(+)